MIADFFTKPLQGRQFKKLRGVIMGMSKEELESDLIHVPTVTFESQECVGNNNNNNTNSRAYSNRGGPCEVVREPTETAGEKTRVEEYQVPADYKRQGLCSHQETNKSSSITRTYSYKPEN